jgi:excisionase family DNA binding protein
MNNVIQGTADEFVQLLRQAVREELKSHVDQSVKPDARPLTKKEAARDLRISLSTLERLIKSNQLPVFNIGKRIFIKRQELDLYLQKNG